MINERIRYKSSRLVTHVFLPLVLILISMKILFNMNNEYIFLNRVLCLCISVLIFIMCIVKIKNRDLGMLKYLGIGCFFIGLIRFWDIEVSHVLFNKQTNIISIQIIIYLELLNIILSMILYYKNSKTSIQWIILSLVLINLYFLFISNINILAM